MILLTDSLLNISPMRAEACSHVRKGVSPCGSQQLRLCTKSIPDPLTGAQGLRSETNVIPFIGTRQWRSPERANPVHTYGPATSHGMEQAEHGREQGGDSLFVSVLRQPEENMLGVMEGTGPGPRSRGPGRIRRMAASVISNSDQVVMRKHWRSPPPHTTAPSVKMEESGDQLDGRTRDRSWRSLCWRSSRRIRRGDPYRVICLG